MNTVIRVNGNTHFHSIATGGGYVHMRNYLIFIKFWFWLILIISKTYLQINPAINMWNTRIEFNGVEYKMLHDSFGYQIDYE